MVKGYFLQEDTVFYIVIMDVPNLDNPPPFPDETEITDDENTIFFRRQRLFITALRDAIIEFLKDGMEHTFQFKPELFDFIKSYFYSANAIDNESVVILRNLFQDKNADFLSFMDVEHEKAGIAVKIPDVKKEKVEEYLSDAIDYVVQQINQENPVAKRMTLEERISYIMEESEKEDVGGAGVGGFPFIDTNLQAEDHAKNSIFSINNLLIKESEENEENEESEAEAEEESLEEDDLTTDGNKREVKH